ncbi:MAG TPA: pirin family protein [Thermoanaerobaculia bacterium]|nr:pirin family protein [Thermoanaerobaculia bacterium]
MERAMLEAHPGHPTHLGELQIWRALPVRDRRLIGPWCFLDRYGPLSFSTEKPMDVAPHPHTGIQTVSWLLEGEVLHRDSLGCEAMARPGAVNVMTSGKGISHSEETPASNIGRLNGVQLWVALPDAHRNDPPAFHHVPEVPREEYRDGFADTFSAHAFSPIVGKDVRVRGTLELPLERAFEHGLFILDGDLALEGRQLDVNTLYYLGADRSHVDLRGNGRFLLLGGEPFAERVLLWWNFAARTPEEIAAARAEWEGGTAFGVVRGYEGPRLHAPELHRFARPNPAS